MNDGSWFLSFFGSIYTIFVFSDDSSITTSTLYTLPFSSPIGCKIGLTIRKNLIVFIIVYRRLLELHVYLRHIF